MHDDSRRAHASIVQRFRALEAGTDAVVVLGSDFTDVTSPSELHFNAAVAANLGASVVLVVHGHHRTPDDVRTAVEQATAELTARHAPPVAVIANRIAPANHAQVLAARGAHDGRHVPTFAIPDDPVLAAPTVAQLVAACDGEVLRGREERLEHESLGLVVAAMSLPNVLDRLQPMHTIIAPGDRGDLIPGLLLAHASASFPALAAVVLTGGYRPAPSIRRLINGDDQNLPVVSTPHDTFLTARVLDHVRGRVSSRSARKVRAARRAFDEHVDVDAILARMNVGRSRAVTPLMFEFDVMARAKAHPRHIVLPEGNDDRILRAAAIIEQRGVARLTVLGEPAAVRAQAGAIGIDLDLHPDGIEVLSPNDPSLVERFAVEYARLRAHKGVTVDEARVVVTDVSYFATMMVHLGLADGMVSGACHTTAETIRPSFEIVKTRPGVDVVSSVFFMCMPDRVLVYGDCAVNPDPDAAQLAAIALSSADTATAFGIEPRIAMLSYSTGRSGVGRDVDKVREATAIVAAHRPDLLVEGPIQYDAASDPEVAAAKLPGSAVAGRATAVTTHDD